MAKRYSGMTADARALATYVKLLRAGENAMRESSRILALYDLTPGQFAVLEAIHQAGPLTLAELGETVLESGESLALAAEKVGRGGLVRRRGNRKSARLSALSLTPKGRILVGSIMPGHGAAIIEVMARLSPKEQETLGRLCQKLGQAPPAGRAGAKSVRERGRGKAKAPR